MFSPAMEMVNTRISLSKRSPSSSLIALTVSPVSFPQMWEASLKVISRLSMNTYIGLGALPLTITASYPAYFSTEGKIQPKEPEENPPVSGLMHPSIPLPAQGAAVAVQGPVVIITSFSGLRGSIAVGKSFQNILVITPSPPSHSLGSMS